MLPLPNFHHQAPNSSNPKIPYPTPCKPVPIYLSLFPQSACLKVTLGGSEDWASLAQWLSQSWQTVPAAKSKGPTRTRRPSDVILVIGPFLTLRQHPLSVASILSKSSWRGGKVWDKNSLTLTVQICVLTLPDGTQCENFILEDSRLEGPSLVLLPS